MISLNPQFIKDATGKNAMVVLTPEEFENIIEELEDAEDVKLYDDAKRGDQEFIDAAQAFNEIENIRTKYKI